MDRYSLYNHQDDCIFCKIVDYQSEARVEFADDDVIAFHPINPVTEDHLLVVPKYHVSDFTDQPLQGMKAFVRAGIMAKRFDNVNLITSKGPAATQSVYHLHFHIVPRHKDDGLALPWYSGKSKAEAPPFKPDESLLVKKFGDAVHYDEPWSPNGVE